MTDEKRQHEWRFFRAGGFDQVLLESGADLQNLTALDQKLWVALSCPVQGIEFPARTLELVDTDHDGHIRVPEIVGALAWAAQRLHNLDILLAAADRLPLTAIDATTEEGARTLASARQILHNLGKEGADDISVDDLGDSERIFANTRFNGDGVITVLSTDDPELQEWLRRIIAICGAVKDRSGEEGVSGEALARFDDAATLWLDWQAQAEQGGAGVIPEGLREEACTLWAEVYEKVEDYFVRCRLAAFDERAIGAMNSPEADLLALGTQNLAAAGKELAALPLSLVTARDLLNLRHGLNPAWAGLMGRFREVVIVPLLGDRDAVTATEWETLKERFEHLATWWAGRVEASITDLGSDLLHQWHAKDCAARLRGLIAEDLALQAEAEAIVEVETLVLIARDFVQLLNNFVSFRDFYTHRRAATFQAGTLYLDGRSCELCVPVSDLAKHAALATLSRLYLVYCDCTRNGGADRMTIAAAITNGDSDQIIVGRNGIFYDRQGRDWDAVVVRIIDHPISLRQAFWAPYKKIGRMVGDQLQKVAAARSKAVEDKAAAGLMSATEKKPDAKVAAGSPAQQQAFDVGKFAGIFAAIGLAVGAIGTALASIVTGLLKLQWWQMPLAVLGVMLIISGPSLVIAWFKLRQRNLGPILDANGWAINARAKLNIPFGASLTSLARLPAGARQLLADPYADKQRPWGKLLLLVIILAGLAVLWAKGLVPIRCK
jgi:hypothetical protein